LVIGLFVCSARPCAAATLTSYTSKEGKVVVILAGEIALGDTEQLQRIIKSANDLGKIVSAVRLNSTGGNLLEGVKLADGIRFGKIASVVPNGSTCASACFIAFAAGADKYASYGASIGVHGASEKNGQETEGSNSATVAMAKIVKELRVPADIIGRMVVTAGTDGLAVTKQSSRNGHDNYGKAGSDSGSQCADTTPAHATHSGSGAAEMGKIL
jgi:hypothetical protein